MSGLIGYVCWQKRKAHFNETCSTHEINITSPRQHSMFAQLRPLISRSIKMNESRVWNERENCALINSHIKCCSFNL